MAERHEKQDQLQGHRRPSALLPGGLPGYDESLQGNCHEENQGLEPNEIDSRSLLHAPSGPPTEPVQQPPQSYQSKSPTEECELTPSQKCQQKQTMEIPDLRGNDKARALIPRNLSTSRTRENSPQRQNDGRRARISALLDSINSNSHVVESSDPLEYDSNDVYETNLHRIAAIHLRDIHILRENFLKLQRDLQRYRNVT